MQIEQKPEERRATIALLKAGMNKMLEAAKQGPRFTVVAEEIEPSGGNADVNHD